jgi:UDP-2,3-diacylglucosamine pyrophosphatase LpxH
MGRTKRIFISDLHLCTERAVSQTLPNHNYGWTRKNTKHLNRFLSSLRTRDDVAELVILGDLLDDWVLPASFDPDPGPGMASTFEAIIGARQNKAIVDNLKAMASSQNPIKVSYVPGNHDMALEKSFLEEHFPGMRCVGQYNPGLGVYQAGSIRAEHGHRFCLFNAPDDLTGTDSYLPLGYYISRCNAQEWLKDGDGAEFLSLLSHTIKKLFAEGGNLPAAVLMAIASEAGMKSGSKFKLPTGLPSPTVAQIRNRFQDLMAQWDASPNHSEVSANQALWADAGILEDIIWQEYGKPSRKPRIVVCGHTHHYALYAYKDGGKFNLGLERDRETPEEGYDFLYANSGTWVDQAPLRTYVETEEDPDQGRHHVRVLKYTATGDSIPMLASHIGMG